VEVSAGFCDVGGGRPAHAAPYVSAHANNLVRRIVVSERAGKYAGLLKVGRRAPKGFGGI